MCHHRVLCHILRCDWVWYECACCVAVTIVDSTPTITWPWSGIYSRVSSIHSVCEHNSSCVIVMHHHRAFASFVSSVSRLVSSHLILCPLMLCSFVILYGSLFRCTFFSSALPCSYLLYHLISFTLLRSGPEFISPCLVAISALVSFTWCPKFRLLQQSSSENML